MNSDELGTRGELHFETVCVTSRLICNKATRDRSGWDFIVEFPIDHANPGRLDQRPNPVSCLIQQKAMWSHNDRIKLRLSSIERLAKDPRPSFIYVLKFDKDKDSPTSAWLIEMRGDVLGIVLRKLREEQAAQRFQVNQAYMYLAPSKMGRQLPPDGKSFRQALVDIVGANNAAYEAAKLNEIKTLGYDKAAGRLSVALELNSREELADVLLGAAPIKVSAMKSSDIRFGITLESDELFERGEIRFSPQPSDTCEISIRRDPLAEPAVYAGNAFFADMKAVSQLAIRIVTEDVEINIRDKAFRFRTTPFHPDTTLKTAPDWRNFFLMADALATPGSILEIRPGNMPIAPIIQKMGSPLNVPDAEWTGSGLAAAGMLTTLIKHGGSIGGPRLTIKELYEQVDSITLAHNALTGVDTATFELEATPEIVSEFGGTVEAVHVNYVSLGSSMLAMALDIELIHDRSKGLYVTTSMELRELTILPEALYDDFVRRQTGDGTKLMLPRVHRMLADSD